MKCIRILCVGAMILGSTVHGDEPKSPAAYRNNANRLAEGRLPITDKQGRSTTKEPGRDRVADAQLKMVWTNTTDYGWNYVMPEFPGGRERFEHQFGSEVHFLEKSVKAKLILELQIPDTPYVFYILDGRVSSYFRDTEKHVIWHIAGEEIEAKFHKLPLIDPRSKRLQLTSRAADSREYLIIDFADADAGPRVKYYHEFHGI